MNMTHNHHLTNRLARLDFEDQAWVLSEAHAQFLGEVECCPEGTNIDFMDFLHNALDLCADPAYRNSIH